LDQEIRASSGHPAPADPEQLPSLQAPLLNLRTFHALEC
jgi:hypothetical protein